jgi:hypothetical protein
LNKKRAPLTFSSKVGGPLTAKTARRDRPLYGDEFGRIKFGNAKKRPPQVSSKRLVKYPNQALISPNETERDTLA